MLTCPRLRHHAPLAHALHQQRLAQGVVDLVGARVGQVLPLQIDVSSLGVSGELGGEVQGSGTPGVVLQEAGQLRLERGVVTGGPVRLVQGHHGRHHRLRHELPPVVAEAASLVGINVLDSAHSQPRQSSSLRLLGIRTPSASRTASTKALTRSGSL